MVAISSRFTGPREVREPDGSFESVLPEATQFERDLQAILFAHKLDAAYERNCARHPLLARLFTRSA